MTTKTSQRPIALVTGGARGIGRAIGDLLVARGWSVAALDVDPKALADIADAPHILPVHCDVADPSSVAEAIALVVRTHGRLDFVCNNAGIGSFDSVQDVSLESWNRVWAINVTSVLLVGREAYPHLSRAPHGSIVNIASDAAFRGIPERAAYCTTKGAVVSLTLAMAADFLAGGVRVNAVAPASVDSDWLRQRDLTSEEIAAAKRQIAARMPMGRLATPEDVARTVAWLASEDAGYVTGQTVVVDGGANSIRLN